MAAVKQVTDNAINIIQGAILEYPVCLNFTYCEYFLTTIRDRVDSLTMCLHALCHAESNVSATAGSLNRAQCTINRKNPFSRRRFVALIVTTSRLRLRLAETSRTGCTSLVIDLSEALCKSNMMRSKS